MSIRTYVAIAALQGVISAYSGENVQLPSDEKAAKMAIDYADELLRQLNVE